jgi:cell division protein FtsN
MRGRSRSGRRPAAAGQGIVEFLLIAILIAVVVIVILVVIQHQVANTTNSNISTGLGAPPASP